MYSRAGFIHGTGAALNIELGWIPDFVIVYNITDGNKVTMANLAKVVAFTSGGTTEIKGGDIIRGLTNVGVWATIREVILDSGSWAGGDAAGWFIFNAEDMHGSFGSENAEVNNSGTNDVAVALQTEAGVDFDTEVAAASGNTGIQSYIGDGDNDYRMGFTIGSTVSTNAKLLGYFAMRNGPGESQGPLVAGLPQSTVW
jgi:hypothetical protein